MDQYSTTLQGKIYFTMAEIEYFYAAHSAYAYLGSQTFMDIAATAGRQIRHKPIDLRRVVAEAGTQPFGKRTSSHVDYYFGREIERWAEFRNAPVMAHLPTHHHRDITLPNCFLIAGIHLGLNIDKLAHAVLTAHWQDDANLADGEILKNIATQAGYPAEDLYAAAATKEVAALYQDYTDDAIARAVFGSPTYGVDGDLFYGQDHLPLVARALEKPFAVGGYQSRPPATST